MSTDSRPQQATPPNTSQSIDWYAEGSGRAIEVPGVVVTVRYLGRKGRRARISIVGPPGTTFRDLE